MAKDLFRNEPLKKGSMVKFAFHSKKFLEKDEEGNVISEHTEFYLIGTRSKSWMLLEVLDGIRELAGSFEEEIYSSDSGEVYIRTFSEATEELENPRTKAIYIEDYSGDLPQVAAVFPYMAISEDEMIKAIDSAKRLRDKPHVIAKQPQNKRRPVVPQSTQRKALVRSEGKCENCGGSLGSVVPHIHHKDGNPKNNELSNLEVLCPNCHSKTQTYKKPKSRTTGQ